MVTPRVADELEPHIGDNLFARQVYGMLRLSSALSRAVEGDHTGANDHAAEAARTAASLGDRPDAFELFGPANVDVWRASFAVEAGNAESALRYAAAVEPRALASGNRRAALGIEKAVPWRCSARTQRRSQNCGAPSACHPSKYTTTR